MNGRDLNTEAQRTQSSRAPSSVNSVAPCFKNMQLEERIANNVAKLLEAAS